MQSAAFYSTTVEYKQWGNPQVRPIELIKLCARGGGGDREVLEISNKLSVGERYGQITHLDVHYNNIVMGGGGG